MCDIYLISERITINFVWVMHGHPDDTPNGLAAPSAPMASRFDIRQSTTPASSRLWLIHSLLACPVFVTQLSDGQHRHSPPAKISRSKKQNRRKMQIVQEHAVVQRARIQRPVPTHMCSDPSGHRKTQWKQIILTGAIVDRATSLLCHSRTLQLLEYYKWNKKDEKKIDFEIWRMVNGRMIELSAVPARMNFRSHSLPSFYYYYSSIFPYKRTKSFHSVLFFILFIVVVVVCVNVAAASNQLFHSFTHLFFSFIFFYFVRCSLRKRKEENGRAGVRRFAFNICMWRWWHIFRYCIRVWDGKIQQKRILLENFELNKFEYSCVASPPLCLQPLPAARGPSVSWVTCMCATNKYIAWRRQRNRKTTQRINLFHLW